MWQGSCIGIQKQQPYHYNSTAIQTSDFVKLAFKGLNTMGGKQFYIICGGLRFNSIAYIGCGRVGNAKDNTSAAILAGRQGNLHLLFGEQETSTLWEPHEGWK